MKTELKLIALPEHIPYHPYVYDSTMKIILDNFPGAKFSLTVPFWFVSDHTTVSNVISDAVAELGE